MSRQTIEYASPSQQRRRWKPSYWHLAGALIALAGVSLPFIPVYETRTRVDAVTGSLERQTKWPFGITTTGGIEPSPLELRLRQMGVTWKRDWHGLSDYSHSIFGNATRLGCGRAPPVVQLRSGMPNFVASAADAEILEFVRLMRTGSDAQQRAAVEAAWEVAFQHMAAAPPAIKR